MSANSIELITSRTISYATGVPIGIREWHVTGCENEENVWDEINLGLILPSKLARWDTTSTGGTISSSGWTFPTVDVRASDYEIRRDPNVYAAWYVRVTYREVGADAPSRNSLPGEVGYISLRSTYEATVVDSWRQWDNNSALLFDLDRTTYATQSGTNPIRTPRYPPGSVDSDIGGNPIDIAGDPTSIISYKQRLVVDLIADTRINAQWLKEYMGTRNFQPFLGVEAGALLFAGADASMISQGKWQHTYNFEADNFFHLVQRPLRMPHGDIILAPGSGQANHIVWVQPFPRTMDFQSIEYNGLLSGL